jgi:predicted nucleic acid-binding protein
MGLTILDAGVIIAILDASDVHHEAAAHAVTLARQRGEILVLPASAFAECLVAPYRRGPEAVAVVNSFVDALPARIEPATRAIASAAAELRARHTGRLRLPDALVVATAVVLAADRVITPDSGWPGLPVTVDVLRPAG